jgi:hypothetical protein
MAGSEREGERKGEKEEWLLEVKERVRKREIRRNGWK